MSIRLDNRDPATSPPRREPASRPRASGACAAPTAIRAETLIELFAWMTGLAIERLGRVPDKLHIALLDMLGIELRPPARRARRRAHPPQRPAQRALNIRGGTEIGTVRTATEESTVFHVQEDFAIAPVRPAAYVDRARWRGEGDRRRRRVGAPHGPDRIPFDQPPARSATRSISGSSRASRACSCRSRSRPRWRAAPGCGPRIHRFAGRRARGRARGPRSRCWPTGPAASTTAPGPSSFSARPASGMEPVAGRRLHWLRCRIAPRRALVSGQTAAYQHAPEIFRITAAPIGALLAAEHSTVEIAEPLGTSSGEPGRDAHPALHARPRARRRRDARGPDAGRRMGAVGGGRVVRGLRPGRSPLHDRPRPWRDPLGPEMHDPERHRNPSWRHRAQGRRAAHVALPPRGRADRQRSRRTA